MAPLPLGRPVAPRIALASGLAVALASSAAAQAPPGYYASVDLTSAATLRATLHDAIDDHTRIPMTSGGVDTWVVLEAADEDPGDAGRILDVYKNASYPKFGAGNAFYQREHTWPSSYGFPDDNASNYPFTDCHALFLCDGSYNAARGNKPFRYCDAGCTEQPTDVNAGAGGGTGVYPGNSSWVTGFSTFGTWETWMGRRGDVARALLYMDVRYEGGSHGGTAAAEPDLILTNDEALIAASSTGSNESVAYMGMLAVLLEWHVQDPVDAKEMARNDAVFLQQGNRNPFVDHPEWVSAIFEDPLAPQGEPWINEFHYDNGGGDVGEFVEVAGPAGLDLAGYRLLAYNGANGEEYDSVDLSGVIPDQSGCLGTLSFAFPDLQNGPDGIALVDPVDGLIEFLSYEASFAATNGPAAGEVATNVGVSEASSAPVGTSLQRVGVGAGGSDFAWQGSAPESPGSINVGQSFADTCGDVDAPAVPTALAAHATDGQVALSWDANGEPDLLGYFVYRGVASGGPYTKLELAAIATPSYLDTSASNGTTYFYVVSAVDQSFNESAQGAEAQATPIAVGAAVGDPWINELHYDNDGADAGEFVEVAGPAGLDLAGWTLQAYNGSGGALYDTVPLVGVLPDQGDCLGTLSVAFPDLQNGGPDGVALVDPSGDVIQFLSYEGSFVATSGDALGLASTNIGVSETGSTPVGFSLQLAGTGKAPQDFTWQSPADDTPGLPNNAQTFVGGCGPAVLPYGCGLNPAGSLSLVRGAPIGGETIVFGVDNPLGTQAVGSIPLVLIGAIPDPGFPCGTPIPGWGMAGGGAAGELLVLLTGSNPIVVGAPWAGAGSPVEIALPLPSNPNLDGVSLYVQGVMIDPFTFGGIGIATAGAFELVIGA